MVVISPKNLDALSQFAKREDKNYPPVFVERTNMRGGNILVHIKDICDFVYDDYTKGKTFAAATRIIHGAPGCGKSTLLMHLGKQNAWKNCKWKDTNVHDPLVLYLSTADDFMNLNSFGHALQTCITRGQSHSRSTSKTTQTGGSLGFDPIAKGHHTVEHHTHYDDPVDALACDGSINWNRPLIIAIDEFQTMGGNWNGKKNEGSHPHVGVLRRLHTGSYKKPIMLVLGGLCDVPDQLLQLGITRLGSQSTHAIGAFKPQETAELIQAWGEKFGIPDGTWKDDIRQLAEDASHWPMHIHNSLCSLADEIVDKEGDINRLNMNAVRNNAAQRQHSYYSKRVSPELKKSKFLLATVMKTIGDESRKVEIHQIIDTIGEVISNPASGSSAWQLPENIGTAAKYVDHLIHQGLIQEQEDKFYQCPIPSLQKHILENHSPPNEPDLPVDDDFSL